MPVAVVTGATSGIGRWIALGLAQAGMTLVLTARDVSRGQAVSAWISSQLPSAQVEVTAVDLALLTATYQTGLSILQRHPAIDVLVNNAGVFRTRREETEEGHERVITVNHLSPFLLTRTLLPALRGAAAGGNGARIINVGSSTSDRARITPADLEGRRRWGIVQAYSQSKLALMMATLDWAQRLQGTGVVANVVHPGTVATSLVRAGGTVGLAWRMMAPFLLTEQQGADTPLHVALSGEFRDRTGTYVKQRQVVAPNSLALNGILRDQVWAATETLVDA